MPKPSYSITQTVAPAIEPITRDEAKSRLRIESSDEDALFDGLIASAREMAEAHTGRQFINATYEMQMDDFPGLHGDIYIPRTPLVSVASVQYVDVAGTLTTLSTDIYDVLSSSVDACIALKPGKTWPMVRSQQRRAVTVTFTAGYGASTADVPQAARSAMILFVGNYFENREETIVGTTVAMLPVGALALLQTITARVPV